MTSFKSKFLVKAWQDERFTYFGMQFAVDKAEQLIAANPRPPQKLPKNFIEGVVGSVEDDEPAEDGSFNINLLTVGVNKGHLDEVDPDKPGILARISYKPTKAYPESKVYSVLIDGNHRAKKCLQLGRDGFDVYVLTPEETWKIMAPYTYPGILKNLVNPTKKPAKPHVKKTGYYDDDDDDAVEDYPGCIGDYVYKTDCVHSDANSINDMIDRSREVSYNLLKKHCAGLREWEVNNGYKRDGSKGLTLRNDYAVSFYKSKYRGMDCYYIRWSAIEFVWVKQR